MQRIEVRSRRKHRIHPIKLTFSNPKALAADQNQISGQGSAKTATSDHPAATNVRSNLTYLVGNRSNLVQPPDNTVHRPGHDRWLRTWVEGDAIIRQLLTQDSHISPFDGGGAHTM